MGLLQGKKIVVTGVLTPESYAYAFAKRALEEGGELFVTALPSRESLVARTVRKLLDTHHAPNLSITETFPMDINRPEDIQAVLKRLDQKWGTVDGVLHSVAFAPQEALGGNFLSTPYEAAALAFQTSAYSLKALTTGLLPLLKGHPSSVVTLTFDTRFAWPGYDWMGVSKAALEAVGRYLARELGQHQIRVNAVSAGPLRSIAARGIPGFDNFANSWDKWAPLGWDIQDGTAVADVVLFLMSNLSRMMTGEILHVDGGAHAVSPPLTSG